MKYLLFYLTFIFLIACKKDGSSVLNPSQSSSRNKFIDTVTNSTTSSEPLFIANTKASNNFFIVQKQSGSFYTLYKADDDMNVINTKTISLGPEKLMQIKGSQVSDDFYTLNATYNFTYTGNTLVNAYVNDNITHDTLSSCNSTTINYYSFNNALNLSSETALQNNSTLRKFDASGNESWNKTLEGNYYESNSLETDLYGNIYVLTANRGGYSPKASNQYTVGPVPYFNFQLDSNQFSLYKFDINGTLIFKKTIINVYDESPGQFTPRLSLSSNNVSVSNSNSIYIFDLMGNLASSVKPLNNSCFNYLKSNVSNVNYPFIFIHGKLNYVNGGSNNPKYFVKYNAGGFNATILNNFGAEITMMDANGNCYCTANNTTLLKLDNTGSIVYSKALYFPPFSVLTTINNTISDKYNSIYIFEKRLNQILSYKLDSNGDFQ